MFALPHAQAMGTSGLGTRPVHVCIASYPDHEDKCSGYEASVDNGPSCPHIAVPMFTRVVWNSRY